MQTVMTSNNAYDCVLLVDDNNEVVSRWDVDRDVLNSYLRDGASADTWHVGEWPRGFDPAMEEDETTAAALRTVAEYGKVVGTNGQVTDESRRQFWGLEK